MPTSTAHYEILKKEFPCITAKFSEFQKLTPIQWEKQKKTTNTRLKSLLDQLQRSLSLEKMYHKERNQITGLPTKRR